MIIINQQLHIPDEELSFSSSRSSGPGGQNVNKVNTRITLNFNLAASPSLNPEQKAILQEKLKNRINKEGVLWVTSHQTRSQSMNRMQAVARFVELLQQALQPQPVRKRTRITHGAKQKRLEGKRLRSQVKSLRTKSFSWD
jgi:ribosome-associated protein